MPLTLQNQRYGEVMVIRCKGRLVAGEETRTLQSEVERLTLETKKFVLQVEEVSYIDSGALGALVRILGRMRAGRGDLKLCQLSPFLLNVLRATNLLGVFHTYATEKEAVEAFAKRAAAPAEAASTAKPRVLCVDPSGDLLAYLNALLKRAGYEVVTTKLLNDASTLAKATRPHLVVFGPGTQTYGAALEKFRQLDPQMQVLLLPADFHVTEAGEAGADLVNRVQAMLRI